MPSLVASPGRSSGYMVLLLVISAIIFRSYQEYLLADFPPDKRIQTATALNFASGNGISIAYAGGEDLSQPEYEKIGLWPPGFPVALAALMSLGIGPFLASYILEVMAIAVLFLSVYGLSRLLKKEVLSWIPLCFILFQTFTIGIYKVSFTNDLISLSFSVCALYLLLKISQEGDRLWLVLLFGLISFLPSFFRFSYYPLSALFPLLLILYAFFIDKTRLAAGLISLSLTAGLIGLQLLYQYNLPTGLSYLDEYHPNAFTSPHWQNLGMFAELPLEMLTNKYLFKRSLDQLHPVLYGLMRNAAWLAFIAALGGLCVKLVREMKQRGRSFFLGPKNQFLATGLIACFVVMGFLTVLSLRYPAETADWMPENKWTYVAEARYFNLLLFLFPLLVLTGFQDLLKTKWISFTLMGTTALFFSFSLLTSLYYSFKYSGNGLKENAAIYYHYQQEVEDYLKERQTSSGEAALLFGPAGDNGGLGIYASLLQIPLAGMQAIEGKTNSRGPVCILLNVSEDQRPETRENLQKLIAEYQLQPVREFPALKVKLYELCLP